MPRLPAIIPPFALLAVTAALVAAALLVGRAQDAAAAVPPNDNSVNATAVGALPFSAQVDTRDASTEPGEHVDCGGVAIGKTVWFTYTPGADGVLKANTEGTDFDTVLAVHAHPFESPPLGLAPIACNDDAPALTTSSVEVLVTAGTAYFFQVGGKNGASSSGAIFNLSYHPANDDFADAQPIFDLPFSANLPTTDATLEAGEFVPPCAPSTGKTVWFRYRAIGDYDLTVQTYGSDFDSVAAIWTMGPTSPPLSLVNVGCADNTFGDDASVGVNTDPGVEYFIQVGGSGGAGGNLALNVIGPLPGSISGTVEDEFGEPIDGAEVVVQSDVCCVFETTFTDANGHYMVDGLLPAQYRVSVDGGAFVDEYYNNQADFESADLVSVTAGINTPNIDFELDLGGIIAGTVTDALGNPIEGASVFAGRDECCFGEFATTDDEGLYAILGLAAGNYRVRASAAGFASEYWDDARAFGDAELVPVALGSIVLDKDFALEAGATISGAVRDEDGNPIAEADIFAGADCQEPASSLLDCSILEFATTAADGTYSLVNLTAGSYRLQISADGFATEFYDNATSLAQAANVTVSAGEVRDNINVRLSAEDAPTATPSPFGTPTATASAGETLTPIATDTVSPHTPSVTTTSEPDDTATPTPAPATPSPSATLAPPTATAAPDDTATSTATASATNTSTPEPSATAEQTATSTPTTSPTTVPPTNTPPPTEQPATSTPLPTNTLPPEPSATASPAATLQPSPTASATLVPQASATQTSVTQPTATNTSAAPAATQTGSSGGQSATRTPTRTASATATRTSVVAGSTATRVNTVLASTAVPTRPAGVTAPDTGAGGNGDGGNHAWAIVIGAAGTAAIATGLRFTRRRA